jgi:hypothetical protein
MVMIAKDWRQLQSAEMNFLRGFKDVSKDHLANISVRDDVAVNALQGCRNTRRQILKGKVFPVLN